MASDIGRTIDFWTTCFGAKVMADELMAGSRNVFLDIGGGRLNLYDAAPNHRGPVNHLGVHVADLAATVARLERAGWAPRAIKVDGPLSYSMVEGPDGLLIEVFHFDRQTTPEHLRPYFDLPPGQRSGDRARRPSDGSSGRPTDESADGTGTLSQEAVARLAKPPTGPLRPPPADDLHAVQRWRASVHADWLQGDPSAEQCGHSEVTIGGVRCLATGPPAARAGRASGPTIIYFHGGGYCLGSPEVALPITERLATYGPVVSVDYRLAPEHAYPAAVEDGRVVFNELKASGPVVLAGDSAGANIALAVALSDPGQVQALALFSPHLEFEPKPGPHSARVDDPLSDVDDHAARWLSAAYLGSRSADDPELAPALGDLSALPPTLVQVGSIDATLGGASRFARRARLAGAPVTLDVWDGLWHTWHYHRDLPEADRALAEAGAFLTGST